MSMTLVGSVQAHHSFAMFDQTKTLSVSGTVKEFQFTSPHAWVQVLVTDDKGQVVEWGFEMGSSAALSRGGWKKNTLKAGDKITVTFNPLKDGNPAGSYKSAVRDNGEPVGPQRAAQ
ncbi:MAG: DUF6152 family protein [Steroidobacteraceae bacterium]